MTALVAQRVQGDESFFRFATDNAKPESKIKLHLKTEAPTHMKHLAQCPSRLAAPGLAVVARRPSDAESDVRVQKVFNRGVQLQHYRADYIMKILSSIPA